MTPEQATRLRVADHEGRAKAVEEEVDVPIGNLRGVQAELLVDEATAGVRLGW